MNRSVAACAVLLTMMATVLTAQKPAGGKTEGAGEATPNALQPLNRYDNRKATLFMAGKSVPSHVTIRDWEIHGRQKIEKFPESGLLIVQLHSGSITTTIGGKQEKRKPGDIWTVPAGTSMGLQVTSESAGLHIVAIGKP